jgi:sulfatase maturation enzyme AslB (radical SAM superfamily)
MSLEKAKKICSVLVHVYGNTAIDIQGGEPTIYKDIFHLIRYCNTIGLFPTLITNALALSSKEKCMAFKEAGVGDFLISVHGLGEVYNKLVGGISRASEKQLKGIDNCISLGIPIRFNCVLSKSSLPQLEDIARLAVQKSVRVVNFIAFNPFEDQKLGGKRSADNVPTYTEVSGYLNHAIDILEDADIECNVRYFPFCMIAERHRKSIYNFQQLPYDLHEWDYASWSWTGMQSQRMKYGDVSPIVSLEYATYGGHPAVDGTLGKFKEPIKKLLNPVPGLLPKAVGIYQTISRAGLRVAKSNGSPQSNIEKVYRDNAKMRARDHCAYAYGDECSTCRIKDICDGFHGDYAEFYGTDEAKPIHDIPIIEDPKYFIVHQNKVREIENIA